MIKCLPNNYITIDFSVALNYGCQIEISTWSSNGVDWSVNHEGETIQSGYKVEPGVPLNTLVQIDAIKAWKESFPSHLLKKLMHFEENYQGSIYPVLWLVSHSIAAKELFESVPLLFWLIIRKGKKEDWTSREIEQVFWMKRADILRACDLQKSKSLLKFLNKFRFKRMTEQLYEVLHHFVKSESYLALSHLKMCDFDLLHFLNNNPEMLRSTLFQNYEKNWSWNEFKSVYEDTFRLGKRIVIDDIQQRILKCRNLTELTKLHDQWTEQLNAQIFEDISFFSYPKPIKVGSEHIVAIENSKDLFQEGRSMNHCIYSYQDDILKGKYCVYKVLEPERATLCIKIMPNGEHLLDQLKLRYNENPSVETKEKVAQWLYKKSMH